MIISVHCNTKVNCYSKFKHFTNRPCYACICIPLPLQTGEWEIKFDLYPQLARPSVSRKPEISPISDRLLMHMYSITTRNEIKIGFIRSRHFVQLMAACLCTCIPPLKKQVDMRSRLGLSPQAKFLEKVCRTLFPLVATCCICQVWVRMQWV